MNRRHSTICICPDCGGILQPTGPEALTTAEVAASDMPERDGTRQCLLCGYTEPSRKDSSPEPWLTR
jgi:hypothetical protein